MHMKNASLRAFLGRCADTRRLGYGDLRRLQRDILPSGPASRAEVEALMRLDLALDRADGGWAGYLVGAVKDFVISASDPPGVVDSALAGWLLSVLTDARPKTALGIARAVLLEAREVDDALQAFAKVSAKRKTGVAASSTGLAGARISSPIVWPGPDQWSSFSFRWSETKENSEPPPAPIETDL
jgi:hypothetical protein